MKFQLNALHAAINEEIHNIGESVTSTSANDSRANYLYADGSVVTPIVSRDEMLVIGEVSRRNSDFKLITYLFGTNESIVKDDSILKVSNANIRLLASYANKMHTEWKGRFYGAVIVDGDRKFNPFHPMIALMIAAGDIVLSDTFTLIMYPYSIDIDIDDDKSEEYFADLASSLTISRSERYLPELRYVAHATEMDNIRSALLHQDSFSVRFLEDGGKIQNALIPVHLATNSLIYPYYGMILSCSETDGSYASTNLYPCLSGNINTRSDSYGTTCVGELSDNAFTSLYVLSNMNTQSMYSSELLPVGIETFIHACQAVSAEFLAFAAGMSFDSPDEPKIEDNAKNDIGSETEYPETTNTHKKGNT